MSESNNNTLITIPDVRPITPETPAEDAGIEAFDTVSEALSALCEDWEALPAETLTAVRSRVRQAVVKFTTYVLDDRVQAKEAVQ
jgi:hypothetical protein